MSELPKKLKPGGAHEVQIAPFGTFENVDGEGNPVSQVCDRAAFENVVKNFSGEVLFDVDHAAELGGSTKAAAWIQSLRVDPKLGLMGTIKLTDAGAQLVNGREYRFLSPAWTCDGNGRPDRLVSVALTNKPNLPVRPVLNRAPDDINPKPREQDAPATKGAPTMEQLKTLLGLPPEATEEQITAAVKALQDAVAAADAAALNAEAEAAATKHAPLIANRADFVKAYVLNKDAALGIIGALKPASMTPPRVTNAVAAQPPASLAAPLLNALETYEKMPPGAEKRKFLNANAAEINKLRVERKAEG